MVRVLKPHQLQTGVVQSSGLYKAERENFLFGFIGHNRTGKSSIMRVTVDKWIANNPNGEIVAFDPQMKFQDVANYLIYPYDVDDAEEKMLSLTNGLIIIDDIRAFHLKDRPEKWLLKLMSDRNYNNVDIIYAIHNPGLLLNTLAYYTTHFFIFYTQVQAGTWSRKVSSYVICSAASTEVNKYVTKHGKGTYPIFPHIIVNNQTQELIAQNMKY